MKKENKKAIEKAVRIILKAIGENPRRLGLKDTPRRIADMYDDIFAGVKHDPKRELKTYQAKN